MTTNNNFKTNRLDQFKSEKVAKSYITKEATKKGIDESYFSIEVVSKPSSTKKIDPKTGKIARVKVYEVWACEPTKTTKVKPVQEKPVKKETLRVGPQEIVRKSSVDTPFIVVREFLHNNKDISRKDAINALVAMGVATGTASTQYYVWKKKNKNLDK